MPLSTPTPQGIMQRSRVMRSQFICLQLEYLSSIVQLRREGPHLLHKLKRFERIKRRPIRCGQGIIVRESGFRPKLYPTTMRHRRWLLET